MKMGKNDAIDEHVKNGIILLVLRLSHFYVPIPSICVQLLLLRMCLLKVEH